MPAIPENGEAAAPDAGNGIADATPTLPVKPTAPSAWDKFVTAVAKPWAVIGARPKSEDEKKRKSGSIAGFTVLPLGGTFHAADRMVRPGSLGSTGYDNRPTIQILSDTDATPQAGAPKFTDFLLHSVQGGDAEKAEVVETFGIPHVFTSGRFMRRYTFAGSLRTTLTAGNRNVIKGTRGHRDGNSDGVSHYAAFLRFYDDYLRVTKQAETGRFTRITVDGETYDGWILSMTPSRESGSEGFGSFSMTMVVRDRNHPKQAAALGQYLKQFAGAAKTKKPKSRAVLNAETVAATGANKITTSVTDSTPAVTKAEFYKVATASLAVQGSVVITGSLAGAVMCFEGGSLSKTANAGEVLNVGFKVDDISKFAGGATTLTLKAGTTTETISFSPANKTPASDPGVVRGAVRGDPPTTFSDLAGIKPLSYRTFVANKLYLGLEFSKEVNSNTPPTVTGAGLSGQLTDVTSKSAQLELTLDAAAGQKLEAASGAASETFAVAFAGGTFTLPGFNLVVNNTKSKPAVGTPVTAFSAVLTESGRGAKNLVIDLVYTIDPAVTDPLGTLAGATLQVDAPTVPLGTGEAVARLVGWSNSPDHTAPVILAATGDTRAIGLGGVGDSNATVRLLAPQANGSTLTQSLLVFFERGVTTPGLNIALKLAPGLQSPPAVRV